MVFANLKNDEKQAFFSLLDEYFASRPDVFNSSGFNKLASGASRAQGAFGSATELKNAFGAPKDPDPASSSPASFSPGRNQSAPPPPRLPPIAHKPTGASGLVSSKKFGDVDTSSKGAMFGSLYHGNKNKNPPPAAPLPPPAFPQKKNAFAPPPSRTAASASEPPARQPEPEPRPQPAEEEARGEWAVALYDYTSQEAGDLQIKENEHVLVTERTSDDWWTGEYNGHKGLFPASYVRLV